MEDITMSDEPGDQSNEPTEQTPTTSEPAIDEAETLTIYAAASSKKRKSGCGNVYIRDDKYVGKAWSLGRLTRRQAAMQAVLNAYDLAAHGRVLGTAKKLVIVTNCKEAEGRSKFWGKQALVVVFFCGFLHGIMRHSQSRVCRGSERWLFMC
ncbi:hypothetical protein EJ03DRAFT_39814 [Teratosphaeria nubilosa]|uniref:Uncharacterized protein n=1 Tax=Teratosphaeria nubilosa TaxID=161662 RepID=A0A6G1LEU4_9PEZI|nr:hypothetical protein EJ03DRAFT_39814 [Teratosphaeria nubilosa]